MVIRISSVGVQVAKEGRVEGTASHLLDHDATQAVCNKHNGTPAEPQIFIFIVIPVVLHRSAH